MPWFLRMTFTFLPALLLAYLYSGWKLYGALTRIWAWPKDQVKFFMIAFGIVVNLHPFLLSAFHAFGWKNLARSFYDGVKIWDIFFTYPFWIGLIVVAELLPFFLLLDILKIPLWSVYNRFKPTWLMFQAYAVLGLTIVVLGYVLIRVVKDTYTVRISTTVLKVPDLPSALQGLTLVHISDIQADSRTRVRKLRRYIRKVNKLNPDLIFFSGDLVTSGKDFIEMGAQALAAMTSRFGKYACLGDHDYWADPRQISSILNQYGIKTLEDANHFVGVNSDSILVTFITNVYSKRPNLDKINALMGSQPRGDLDIILAHQPSENLVELAAERGYHLFLAGHTHGGQIVFKPFGYALTPSKFETPYFQGYYLVEKMLLSVTNGLGLTFAPFRYQAPAEISVIKLARSSPLSD